MNETKTKRSEKLVIQPRDVEIFKFLDRVGYASLSQVTKSTGVEVTEKSQAAILKRLYLLLRFEYIKLFSTHRGNYYALTNKSKLDNALLYSIKLDQLDHHDFLIELFFHVKNEPNVLSEREAIANFKIVGKKGKIPDMVINEWVIEYERTNKSVIDSKSVVEYWTVEQGKNLCVIYANDEIRNRYTSLINPRVKLLARADYRNILSVLVSGSPGNSINPNASPNIINNDEFVDNVRNKYL